MTIDAHQHFWQFDPLRDAWIKDHMSVLRHDFLPPQLALLLQTCRIDGCVAVQADQSLSETAFLLDLARHYPFIKGIVGWVDLRAANLPEQLNRWQSATKLKGFRHILQAENPAFMLETPFIRGLKTLHQFGYTYDLLVFPRHLKAVHHLLKAIDRQPLVIDHLAKPYIQRGLVRQWAADLKKLARHKHVFAKISGLVTEANWNNWRPQQFFPYLEIALEAFGPKRLMYGSDWPVCLLAADYDTQFSLVQQLIQPLTATEQQDIMGGTATRFYRLNEP